MTLKLYNFFRNSAGFRVRIALHLKGLDFDYVSIDIRPGMDKQLTPEFRKINPLGLIPALEHDGKIITQSSAIIEYLEELYPTPSLLPKDAVVRAQSRAFAAAIAGEIHALNNTRVHTFFREKLGLTPEQRDLWFGEWNRRGFAALEAMLAAGPALPFTFADTPTIADIFLVPHYYNLRRAKFDLAPYPRINEIVARCEALPAFQKAAPETQPDYIEGQ